MPETLTDILAAALRTFGPANVVAADDLLAAIPARDREAWETGRLLAEAIAKTPDGWHTCELKPNELDFDVGDGTGWVVSVAAPEWWSGESDDRDAHLRIGHGDTPHAALAALVAQLDPTR